MNATRMLAAVVVSAALMAAIGYTSRAPYQPRGSEQSLLRLSWRLRGEKLQTCRARTAEELASVPAHMRTPQVCVGHLVSYRLSVQVDGAAPDTVTFAPAGAKGDRPLLVLHDVPLAPGPHMITVDFTPLQHIEGSKHKPLHFETRLTARRGRIELITLTRDASQLMLMAQ